jgi:hypothetical protein
VENFLVGCWLVQVDLRGISETFFSHLELFRGLDGQFSSLKGGQICARRQFEYTNSHSRKGEGYHGYNSKDVGYWFPRNSIANCYLIQVHCSFRPRKPTAGLGSSSSMYKELDKLG